MSNVYSSRDYTIKLDGNVTNADEVREKVHPAPPGGLTDADILLMMQLADDFDLELGDHKVTLIPRDRSKQTITYNVMLRSSRDIDPYSIKFLRNGSPEETPTQDPT